MMEAVITCVGYSHYLAFTHPLNRAAFDHYIVVTAERDRETQAYCAANGITCVVTEVMFRPGVTFDRGSANNEGFKALKHHDWVCHLDVDTVLSDGIRSYLPILDTECMYGARRVVLERMVDYQDYVSGAKGLSEFERPEGCGFGYFQLFNWQSSVIKSLPYGAWYPAHHDVSDSDWRFRNRWGKPVGDRCTDNLRELPFPVIHLGAHGNDSESRRRDTFFSASSRVRDNLSHTL